MASPNLANIERFIGFADGYDRYRPRPPAALLALLMQLSDSPRPELVIDIGCGTGLSTIAWATHAQAVVGVEPSPDMRRVAERQAATVEGRNVRILAGHSAAIDLPDACADIITAAQALHWMEPQPTFAEVARLLRPGGVFAAYDYDAPPTAHWRIDQAHAHVVQRVAELTPQRGSAPGVHQWDKSGHLDRMAASGYFRWTRLVWLHQVIASNAERFIGGMRTYGGLVSLLKSGASLAEVGLDAYDQTVRQVVADGSIDCYWSYQVCLGVR
jgi:SAM-dependent methyltransferase